MNKEMLSAYFKWLETASDEQISKARQDLEEQIPKFRDANVKREAKFRLKLLEEEFLARMTFGLFRSN